MPKARKQRGILQTTWQHAKKVLKGIYYFLPIQLVLLHFRKYQLLLIFWFILAATITGHFAQHFGAASLFLSPEYLGNFNYISMFLLGGAMGVYIMGWHITTFIIHGHRIPYMGAAKQTFLVYCINNSIIPILFLVFYSIVSVRFELYNEHAMLKDILELQGSFYAGILIIILISFVYFFRVGRDLLKVVVSKITNPARIREIIPYDTLDYEIDIIRADSYISENLHIMQCSELEHYHPRLLRTVLRRHHRNAITATIFSYIFLVILGIFSNVPYLRIPAGAGFLILFSITMGIVGAVKYFLKSWEILGWAIIILIAGWMVKHKLFDLRSIAYGVNYHVRSSQQPQYSYDYLQKLFTRQRYEDDKNTELARLENWKKKVDSGDNKPPLVVVTVSGGGTRAAYWTFRSLQYIDSVTKGKLFKNTVLITGASGGMLGAAYWRAVHNAYNEGKLNDPYDSKYQENIGKDLLNSIIFSMVTVDLISPFNKVYVNGYAYTKDRGYAMEQQLIKNTDGLIDKQIGDYKQGETSGDIPEMIINGTIINDGRKLMISAQPISYLTRPEYELNDTAEPQIDAIDFGEFFAEENPYNLRLTSALRMNATFPYILPVVKLPSQPAMNIMDAGLRDNFGMETADRYLYVMRNWIKQNIGNVIFLEIRDTREYEVRPISVQNGLGNMLYDPLFVIQEKWEAFQSYSDSYLKDYAPNDLDGKLHFVSLQFVPQQQKSVALNLHLTQKEKEDLYQSIHYQGNQREIDTLIRLINH